MGATPRASLASESALACAGLAGLTVKPTLTRAWTHIHTPLIASSGLVRVSWEAEERKEGAKKHEPIEIDTEAVEH